jgi:hypothetical protein
MDPPSMGNAGNKEGLLLGGGGGGGPPVDKTSVSWQHMTKMTKEARVKHAYLTVGREVGVLPVVGAWSLWLVEEEVQQV